MEIRPRLVFVTMGKTREPNGTGRSFAIQRSEIDGSDAGRQVGGDRDMLESGVLGVSREGGWIDPETLSLNEFTPVSFKLLTNRRIVELQKRLLEDGVMWGEKFD